MRWQGFLVAAFGVGAAAFGGELEAVIEATARRHQIDPALVRAVIAVESGGNRLAVSAKGAKGLMQLMPGTAREVGVRRIFDAAENVRGGVAYLAAQLRRFRDVKLALAAYNAGPAAVARAGGIPRIRETRRYVRKVLARYASLLRRRDRGKWLDLSQERGLTVDLSTPGTMLALQPATES